MNKITELLRRLRNIRSFGEKFSPDGESFGGREQEWRGRWRKRTPRLLICFLGGIMLVVALLLISKLWKATEIKTQDGQLYSATVICKYADVEVGDEMLGFDARAVVRRLRKGLPLLDDVKVSKHLDGTVTITFTEHTELYYTCHNSNYYIISERDHEVLGVFANPNEAKRVGAVYLGLPESTRVRVGEKLAFINLPYTSESASDSQVDYEIETDEPKKEYAYVFDFVDELMDSPLADRVTGMELGDRYDLWLVLDKRVKVRIGGMEELERKLNMVERSLEDRLAAGKDDPSLPLLVDVSDPTRIIHRASPDIELPDWTDSPA